METVKAWFSWAGPEDDRLYVFVDPLYPDWMADPIDDGGQFFLLRVLDEDERETGEIAGFEILSFLQFDRWSELPRLPILWELPGKEPLPLEQFLRREQAIRANLAASAASGVT